MKQASTPDLKPLISLIIPMKNEGPNVEAIHAAIERVSVNLPDYGFEYVFVDDGSTDDCAQRVKKLAVEDKKIRLIRLARHFGKEIATTAGLNQCQGDAAIMIDADLQHPPALIPQFIEQWEAGYDVVIGKQQPDASYASFFKRLSARWYYKLMNVISSVEITPHATDFRLIDRVVIDEFNRFTERNRMTRGLIDWLGFSRTFIAFTPDKRLHGQRTYSYRSLLKLATNSIVSLSIFPLRIAGYLGGFIVLVSTPLIIFILANKLFDHNSLNFTGSATLAAMLLFLIGIVLVCLGLMALYIANIHGEVLNRPLYVMRRETHRRRP